MFCLVSGDLQNTTGFDCQVDKVYGATRRNPNDLLLAEC